MGLFQRLLSALGMRKRDPEADDELPDEEEARDASAPSEASPDPDPERDPELEAKDDAASFDFERDIARFFTAEFRIEQAWANLPRRQQLFSEYQVTGVAHWYQVRATFERWLESPEGKAKYPNDAALMQARMTTTQTVTLDELEAMIEDSRRAKG
jgi:hypothetical protein